MKKIILFGLIFCSFSIVKGDYSHIYAAAISCAKNGGNDCKSLIEHIFKLNFIKRKAVLTAIGGNHLRQNSPISDVHKLSLKLVNQKVPTTTLCPFYTPFESNNVPSRCAEVWAMWIKNVCGTEDYCQRVREAYLSSKRVNNRN